MVSNNQIKFLKSLSNSKFRQKYNNFIAEGDKLAYELINSQSYEIESVFATSDWLLNNNDLLSKTVCPAFEIEKRQMGQISQLKNPSSVYLLVKKPTIPKENIENSNHILLLDGVQDPGNVGTIIRVCDWFGIKCVIGTEKTADFFHPKVVQASMGSICHIILDRLPIHDILTICKDRPLYTMDLDGSDLSDIKIQPKSIIVLGNEGQGVSKEIQSLDPIKVYIPGSASRGAESLNVSIAAGIFCNHLFNSTLMK